MYKADLQKIISQAFDRLVLDDEAITITELIGGLEVNASNHVDQVRVQVNRNVIANLKT